MVTLLCTETRRKMHGGREYDKHIDITPIELNEKADVLKEVVEYKTLSWQKVTTITYHSNYTIYMHKPTKTKFC